MTDYLIYKCSEKQSNASNEADILDQCSPSLGVFKAFLGFQDATFLMKQKGQSIPSSHQAQRSAVATRLTVNIDTERTVPTLFEMKIEF